MNRKEYDDFLTKYYETHQSDFIGIHDCHAYDTEEKNNGQKRAMMILGTGLQCSNFRNKEIPLENNYRATMYNLHDHYQYNLFDYARKQYPSKTCIILVQIPKVILDLIENHGFDEQIIFRIISEQASLIGVDENGNRIIESPSTDHPANINIIPSYFIKGFFNQAKIDTNEDVFSENPNYFENLPEEEQNIIIEHIKERYIKFIEKNPPKKKESD